MNVLEIDKMIEQYPMNRWLILNHLQNRIFAATGGLVVIPNPVIIPPEFQRKFAEMVWR